MGRRPYTWWQGRTRGLRPAVAWVSASARDVTSLPGSGKSTLAGMLADHLGLAFIDKDDILDALLDALGAPEVEQRQRLSRAADAVLQGVASKTPGAVVCSFWRRERLSVTSGTP